MYYRSSLVYQSDLFLMSWASCFNLVNSAPVLVSNARVLNRVSTYILKNNPLREYLGEEIVCSKLQTAIGPSNMAPIVAKLGQTNPTLSYGSETGVERLGLRIIISEIKI